MRLNSLKTRFVIAIVVIVSASSFLFALVLLTVKNRLEEVTFGEMVREQLQFVLAQYPGEESPPLMSDWELVRGTAVDRLPPPLASLPPGSHHSVRAESRYYQVEVGQVEVGQLEVGQVEVGQLEVGQAEVAQVEAASVGTKRVMLLYDITEWEDQEHAVLALLGWGMLVILLLAVILGILTARPALKPLRDLTGRLASIRPDERKQRIGAAFAGTEVGVIANEFDRYLNRLDDFVEREKFFTAAASHELRTPLSVVMGAVDIVEAHDPDPVTRRALSRISRACDDMLAFIETTLFLAREDAHNANETAECDLGEVIAELLTELDETFAARGIRINNRIGSGQPRKASPSLVKMVVGNILRNAIEHTRDGDVTLTIDGSALVISDQGEGIAPENLDRVYEHHFSTKPGGTGMGLSLVKRICDRFGWQIAISSEPKRGTTVRVTLAR